MEQNPLHAGVRGTAEATAGTSTVRFAGLDLARALAVFGMYAAHVGPDPSVGGPVGAAMTLASGRASTLFALLAGLSLVILAGRRQPKTGLAGRQAAARIAIRAVVLLALGIALTVSGTSIVVILAHYGVFFLLALPLVRLRAATLAVIAAAWALVGPQLSFVLRRLLDSGAADLAGSVATGTSGGAATGLFGKVEGPTTMLLSGAYPVITWMPFVIAGMALGRLDLSAPAVQRRLAALAAGLLAGGYGLSWLLQRSFPGTAASSLTALPSDAAFGAGGTEAAKGMSKGLGSGGMMSPSGAVSTDNPANLLGSSPHSGTTFEILGNTGVAILLVVGCLALLARLPMAQRALGPVIAVGTMSLTAYVGHIVGVAALGNNDVVGSPLRVYLCFVLVAIAFAALWSRYFRRGPLEYLLNVATKPAARLT